MKKNQKKNFLFLPGPKNPAQALNSFVDDVYINLATEMIKMDLINKAIFVYNNHPLLKQKEFDISDRIKVYFISSKKLKLNKDNFKGVLCRGNYEEHPAIMKNINFEHGFFYAADYDFLPTKVPIKFFDTILVDEEDQAKKIKHLFPKLKATIFDKPVNDEIFKPRMLKKVYDLCYVANFRQWKFHNVLFSAIRNLNLKGFDLKIALAGKFEPSRRELETMLKKYGIKADLFEMVKQEKIAQIFNQAKFSVQLAEIDANPRSLTESIACGTPVLLNKQSSSGKRLINSQTGKIISFSNLSFGIEFMLANYEKFSPRKYFEKNLNSKIIINRCFKELL